MMSTSDARMISSARRGSVLTLGNASVATADSKKRAFFWIDSASVKRTSGSTRAEGDPREARAAARIQDVPRFSEESPWHDRIHHVFDRRFACSGDPGQIEMPICFFDQGQMFGRFRHHNFPARKIGRQDLLQLGFEAHDSYSHIAGITHREA